jgi:hypothetical protein
VFAILRAFFSKISSQFGFLHDFRTSFPDMSVPALLLIFLPCSLRCIFVFPLFYQDPLIAIAPLEFPFAILRRTREKPIRFVSVGIRAQNT